MRGRLVERRWVYDPTLYAPPRYRRACAYEAFIPEKLGGLSLSLDSALASSLSDAETQVLNLNRFEQPALVPLARLLLRSEAIASSKIEGMQVETAALARAEARLDAGQNVAKEALEVIANVDAMQLAIEEAASERGLTVGQVRAIHRELVQRTSSAQIAGRIRTEQNWIGGNDYNPCGAEYVPPPPEEVGHLLEDLLEFCADESLPPLIQAAIAHAQFETIHPFADGNGRTGRALIHVLLRRRGLATSYVPPISVVLADRRERYIDGLSGFREERLMEWVSLFVEAAGRAASLARQYVDSVTNLQEQWREELRRAINPRADSAAWAIIDVLPAHPVLTVSVGVAATERSKPAIGQGIGHLVEAGILSPLGAGQRNRMWEAPDLLGVLKELDRAQPPQS